MFLGLWRFCPCTATASIPSSTHSLILYRWKSLGTSISDDRRFYFRKRMIRSTMLRELSRDTQQEFQNQEWGAEKTLRLVELVSKHLEVVGEVIKPLNSNLMEVGTNAQHLLLQLRYNIDYVNKQVSTPPPNKSRSLKDQTGQTQMIGELEKIRKESYDKAINGMFEQVQHKHSIMKVDFKEVTSGGLNYQLKYKAKEVQTDVLACELSMTQNRLSNIEDEREKMEEANRCLKEENQQKKLQLATLNNTFMEVLLAKTLLEARFAQLKELKPEVIEKTLIDYSEIERRLNQGYANIMDRLVKHSAENIASTGTAYKPSGGNRMLKCATAFNVFVLPKSKENMDKMSEYYASISISNTMDAQEAAKLIHSVEQKDKRIFELEQKLETFDSLTKENYTKIVKERFITNTTAVCKEMEAQTDIYIGKDDKIGSLQEWKEKTGVIRGGEVEQKERKKNKFSQEGSGEEMSAGEEDKAKTSKRQCDGPKNLPNFQRDKSRNKSRESSDLAFEEDGIRLLSTNTVDDSTQTTTELLVHALKELRISHPDLIVSEKPRVVGDSELMEEKEKERLLKSNTSPLHRVGNKSQLLNKPEILSKKIRKAYQPGNNKEGYDQHQSSLTNVDFVQEDDYRHKENRGHQNPKSREQVYQSHLKDPNSPSTKYPQFPKQTHRTDIRQSQLSQNRKRTGSLPLKKQINTAEGPKHEGSFNLPKISTTQHVRSHAKDVSSESKKIQLKIQMLKDQIQSQGKGRSKQSNFQLQRCMKLLQNLHKGCGADCKYLWRINKGHYTDPLNKKQLQIPKYDLVYDHQNE